MERDKQIEKIARDICECFNNNGTCFQDDKPCDCKCGSFSEAQYLYKKGYRKASEVAKEIFADLEKWFAIDGNIRLITAEKFAEIKNKYEGEGKE